MPRPPKSHLTDTFDTTVKWKGMGREQNVMGIEWNGNKIEQQRIGME
jgi:hypothetical protein